MREARGTASPLVLHVTTVPESFGFLRGQLGYMRAQGFRVQLVASAGAYAAVVREQEGVTVHTVEMPRAITPLRDLRAVLELAALMRRLSPAIVHAHTPKGGLLGMIAATIARAPVKVYHMRGLPLETAFGARRVLLTLTERISCALATRVICVSTSLREVALRLRLVPPRRAVVLAGGSGNGVDALGRFAPRDDDTVLRARVRAELRVPDDSELVLFVGRVVKDKGVEELAGAWSSVREAHPRSVLVVVGPEEDGDPVEPAVLAALHGDSRVRLLGLVRDIRPLLAAAEVLVLPTHREGFPNVLLEAAAMRLPVVATVVTGCVDAVEDGVTGQLVPVRARVPLAAAIARYVGDAPLRRRHGDAARERVLREFDQRRIWRSLEALYRELLIARLDRLAVQTDTAAHDG